MTILQRYHLPMPVKLLCLVHYTFLIQLLANSTLIFIVLPVCQAILSSPTSDVASLVDASLAFHHQLEFWIFIQFIPRRTLLHPFPLDFLCVYRSIDLNKKKKVETQTCVHVDLACHLS
ncbi:hypothetical protein, variant [Capsaspora owczarzaki ATCC 30864]|uniref:Uncharacterized protein n=1 Tax=Capsaspora owczarzaki (strain ATCC 30864) TaxID=595528 RepID=A0A0D2UR85_CAPO3|nr:hypothetical protein CAOG_010134 [Capsaspora owczarzaki ATCC 30864]KJE97511.1 hypothetical protein, variant [Capsaspora owczarzaki ATCC 30864]